MNRWNAFVVLLVLVLPLRGWGEVLCQFVDGGVASPVAVDESTADFERYGDVYKGAAVSRRWAGSPLYKRYQVTDDDQEALSPRGVRKRLEVLALAVEGSPAFNESGNNAALLKAYLLAELHGLSAAVAPLEDRTLVSWQAVKDAPLARFNQVNVASEECRDGFYATNSAFFTVGGPAKETIALRLEKQIEAISGIFAEDPSQRFYIATLEQAIEFRSVVDEVKRLFAPLQQMAVNEAAIKLVEIDQGWSNYLEKGYSQYPWESLLNSLAVSYSWSSPPESQWLVMHPEMAAVVDARSTSGSSLEGALLVHGVGYIRYFGDERDWFLGASLTGSITTDSDVGLGVGGTVHFGHTAIHSKVPHISVSVLFHDTVRGSSGPFIAVSADLWRLFQSESAQRLYQQALSSLPR